MASLHRANYGDPKPIKVKVDPVNYPVEEGDLLCRITTTGICIPAQAFAALKNWGAASVVQAVVAKHCVGRAMQKCGAQTGEKLFHIAIDDTCCMVATGGVVEMDCDSEDSAVDAQYQGAYEGAMMGIYVSGTTVTSSQKMAYVTDPDACIGFLRKQRPDLAQSTAGADLDLTTCFVELSPGAVNGGIGRLGVKGAGTYTNVSGD